MNSQREHNSLYLRKRLGDIDWLKIPKVSPDVKHAWFWCPVEVDEETLGVTTLELVNFLKERGIEVRHRYLEPLYRQPVIQKLNPRKKNYNCPIAEEVAGRIIGLPNHPKLTLKDLSKIVGVLNNL